MSWSTYPSPDLTDFLGFLMYFSGERSLFEAVCFHGDVERVTFASLTTTDSGVNPYVKYWTWVRGNDRSVRDHVTLGRMNHSIYTRTLTRLMSKV